MDTENNQIKIHEYISNINIANIYGGDIEISLAYEIYFFNLAVYKEIRDSEDNLFNLSFINYINNNNEKIQIYYY